MEEAKSILLPPDAVSIAAQMGRLDFVSLLLTAIGTILVVGGFAAYFNLRAVAKAQATEEARKIAEATAERVTNEYLQKELPELLREYEGFFGSDGISDADADRMAEAQDDAHDDKTV